MKSLWLRCTPLILWGTVMAFLSSQSFSQPAVWPDKPVRLVVPYAPGGTTDYAGRQIGQKLTELTGKSFIVENKSGGSGTIGTLDVARSNPDGYTMLVTDTTYAMLPVAFAKLPWDHKSDLIHITEIIETPVVLVVPASSPFKTLAELISFAKANPGKLNFGSGGSGSSTQLAAEVFKTEAGVSITHIPYRGAGAAASSLLAGQIDMLITAAPTAIPHITSGRTRALAITGKDRLQILPEVPTFSEAGLPSFNIVNWFGLAAPKGTPPAIVNKIRDLVAEAMKDPNLRNNFAKQGAAFNEMSVETFGNFVNSEIVKWSEEGNKAGVKPE